MSQVYRDIFLLTSGDLDIEMSFVATILEDSFSCQYCPHQRIRHCASSRIIIESLSDQMMPRAHLFLVLGVILLQAGRHSLIDYPPMF